MPRVRLIAGPNGSGKTTLFKTLQQHQDVHFGQYINPDDVADTLKGFKPTNSALPLIDDDRYKAAQNICVGLRDKYLEQGLSLTYESVMSHSSHLDYIKMANSKGFKTYLYYTCINDPDVNIERVSARVKTGGHPVPTDKIVKRYFASLEQLFEMASICHRAYFFDNSFTQELFAEKSENNLLKIDQSRYNQIAPIWFQEYVLSKWDKGLLRLIEYS